MREEELANEWNALNNKDIDDICAKLRNHEKHIREHLASFVASLCDIDVDDMLKNNTQNDTMRARWLYWYAYRYMTNESYRMIAERMQKLGCNYTLQGVTSSVNKMGNLISSNTIWTKRWIILKRIIKARNSEQDEIADVVIHAPKELEGKIKIEIIKKSK